MKSKRPVTLAQAKSMYVHRFTMDHMPDWARTPAGNGKYYAPQYRSDQEWYDLTLFLGESPLASKGFCFSSNQTWPLGLWLNEPFKPGVRG